MNKRKIIGFIIGLIMFAATVTSLSYAYYSWSSTNTDITFNLNDQYFYCETDIVSNISNLAPVNDYKQGVLHKFKVNNIANKETYFSITLDISAIDEPLKDESFKYIIYVDKTNGSHNCQVSDNGCDIVGQGNFKNAKVGKNTLVSSERLPNNSRYEYYLFLYIDGTMTNPANIQTSSITATLLGCDIYVTFDPTYVTVSPTWNRVF